MAHSRLMCHKCKCALTPLERDYYNEHGGRGPRYCSNCMITLGMDNFGRTECQELDEIEENREQGNLFDGKQEAHTL